MVMRNLRSIDTDNQNDKRNSVYDYTVLRNMKRSNNDLDNGKTSIIRDAMIMRNLRSIDKDSIISRNWMSGNNAKRMIMRILRSGNNVKQNDIYNDTACITKDK